MTTIMKHSERPGKHHTQDAILKVPEQIIRSTYRKGMDKQILARGQIGRSIFLDNSVVHCDL